MKQENAFKCPKCGGRLQLRNGRNGPFVGCESYPSCRYTRGGLVPSSEEIIEEFSLEKALHLMINGTEIIHQGTGTIWSYIDGTFFKNYESTAIDNPPADGYSIYEGKGETEPEIKHYKPLNIIYSEVAFLDFALDALRLPKDDSVSTGKESDLKLAAKLIKRGDDHAKAMRGIKVAVKFSCQVGWLIERLTYTIGTDCLSSSSSMHNELAKLTGEALAEEKQRGLMDKVYVRSEEWNYQSLRRVYLQRRKHRHPDWQIFISWIERLPCFEYLIYPEMNPTL